jgi:hypothetical protein
MFVIIPVYLQHVTSNKYMEAMGEKIEMHKLGEGFVTFNTRLNSKLVM